METSNDNILPEEQSDNRTTNPSVVAVSPIADSAMATGTDDEPEMTIADKHTGESVPDPNGDGKLTTSEAAALLGENSSNK